ncbi:hypothetical protein B0G66_11326 [Bacillus badius]|nr:hypothetical protein B0G66_11326 [Bacillus badius]
MNGLFITEVFVRLQEFRENDQPLPSWLRLPDIGLQTGV